MRFASLVNLAWAFGSSSSFGSLERMGCKPSLGQVPNCPCHSSLERFTCPTARKSNPATNPAAPSRTGHFVLVVGIVGAVHKVFHLAEGEVGPWGLCLGREGFSCAEPRLVAARAVSSCQPWLTASRAAARPHDVRRLNSRGTLPSSTNRRQASQRTGARGESQTAR